jgi:glycosyltransferase involved in cell wall biosynthesis
MINNKELPKIGYVAKMYPRLSETFILNEMLELERQGTELSVFSIKKPNEGRFHPQTSDLKAEVYYLEDLESKKWVKWLNEIWPYLEPYKDNFFRMFETVLLKRDYNEMELFQQSVWAAGKAVELGINHIHAHFGSMPSTVAYYIKEITGISFSFTAHAKDIFVYNMEEHHLRTKLFAADFTITVTNYNKNFLLEENPGLDSDKIKVLYNGTKIDFISPVPPEKRDKNTILSVGRLVPKKGFDTLIEACSILKNNGSNFKCLISGDGAEFENLNTQISKSELSDHVELLGAKTQDQVLKLMQTATLLCLPCRITGDGNRDALPTVLLEGLASGLPMISTNISGIPEIIESGNTGILVEPDDPIDLAKQIGKLLKSSELQTKFSIDGRKRAEKLFDIKANAGTLLKMITTCVNENINI